MISVKDYSGNVKEYFIPKGNDPFQRSDHKKSQKRHCKGSVIVPNQISMDGDKRYWENPEEFRIER
jgi:hypothetical protein